jgi:hypothetical protein
MNERYIISSRTANQLSRMLRSRPLPAANRVQAGPGRSPEQTVAKIEAHEGVGLYKAIEVFWNGAAWSSDADLSRKFGTAYGTPPLLNLSGSTEVEADTIVRIQPVYVRDSTSLPVWIFGESSGGTYTYDGPFAVTNHDTDVNKVTVGALRSATRPDLCFIVPDAPLTKTVAEHVTVTANGYIYATVTREGVLALAAPAYASSLPACTATTIPWPLAYVTFADGAVTSIFQLQYGQIVTYKTISCTCS